MNVAPPRHLLDAEGVVAVLHEELPHGFKDQIVEGWVARPPNGAPLDLC